MPVLTELSMVIAGFFYPRLADRIGRKLTLLSISIPYFVSIILTATARNIYLFHLARILVGIGDCCVISTLPSYIGEISTPKVRGFWGNIPTCYGLLGHLFINAVGGYLNITTTAWIMLLFPTVFVIAFSFAPESPYFHIMKSQTDKAKESLQKLRGCQDVDDELLAIERGIHSEFSEICTWKELLANEDNRKGLIACVFLRSSQVLSGITCFATYNQYIFARSAGNISAANSAIIYNVLLLFCTLITMQFIDKLGRRIVIIVSAIGCGLSLTIVSCYFYIESNMPAVIGNVTWIPLAGMIFYVISFSFGLSTVPSLMLGELFSSSAKTKALSVLIVVVGFWVAVTAKLFQLLNTYFGMHVPFAFFSVCCFCSTILAFYLVPETKGKTLEEIQVSLKKSKTPVQDEIDKVTY